MGFKDYNPNHWKKGDLISSERLNAIETAIDENNAQIQANIDALEELKEVINVAEEAIGNMQEKFVINQDMQQQLNSASSAVANISASIANMSDKLADTAIASVRNSSELLKFRGDLRHLEQEVARIKSDRDRSISEIITRIGMINARIDAIEGKPVDKVEVSLDDIKVGLTDKIELAPGDKIKVEIIKD